VNRQIGVEESKYVVTFDPLFTGREEVTWPTFRISWERLELESSNFVRQWIITIRVTIN